jgi:hypothetical protein
MIRLMAVAVVLSLWGCGGGEGDDDGVPTIKVDPGFWEGPLTVKGTISLPADAASGRFTQFEFMRVNAGLHSGNSVQSGPNTTDSKTVLFEIAGLEDGEYKFRFFADQSGDSRVGPGDLEGWYGGTVASPIQDRDAGLVLKLEGRNHEGIDFGVALAP